MSEDVGRSAGIPATPVSTPPAPPEATATATLEPHGNPEGQNGNGSTAEQAKETAQGLASKVSQQAASQVDQRTSDLGQRVSSVVGDLRQVGEQLQGQENQQAAKVANSTADQAERVAGYLQDVDGQRLLSDVEDLGRRQPLLVLAGGMALGVAAARVLKASSSDRYQRASSASTGTV
jgi:hypothetical protein